jgi:hypothetical protein
MKASKSLTVDLADPSSILAKLPEAEETLAQMQLELEERQSEIIRWRDLVALMQALAAEPHKAGSLVAAEPAHQLTDLQALVVGVVNREVRKIRAKEVTEVLRAEGYAISGDSVSNTLWHVAEKLSPKPIQRIGRGFYAPLAYKEPEPTSGEVAATALAGIGAGALAAHLKKAGGA